MGLDAASPFTPRIRLHQLDDPIVLSKYINEDVESVVLNQQGVGEGAGGTGTTRRALIAKLKNGKVLHLFAKTAAESMTERTFLNQFNIYDNELNFYQNICPKLVEDTLRLDYDNEDNKDDAWVPCPKVYCAKQLGRTNFLLILEDTRFRKQGSIYSTIKDSFQMDSGKLVIKEYAKLHAKYWRTPPSNMWRYCNKTGRSLGNTPPYNRFLASQAMKRVKTLWIHKLKLYPDLEIAFEKLLANYGKVRAYWSSCGPMTFAHGDSHIGNTFFSGDRNQAGFVDYQCVSEEHGLRDISYYLMMSCHPVVLARVEQEMIEFYLSELKHAMIKYGKEQYVNDIPNYEEAYFMYRSYTLWVLSAWIICCGFLDVVKEDYIIFALQTTFDTCQRLDCLGILNDIIERAEKKKNI